MLAGEPAHDGVGIGDLGEQPVASGEDDVEVGRGGAEFALRAFVEASARENDFPGGEGGLRESDRREEQAADEGKAGEEFHGRCNGETGHARQDRTWSGSIPRPLLLINPTKNQ